MKGLDLLGALSLEAREQMLASRFQRPTTTKSKPTPAATPSATGLAAALQAAAQAALTKPPAASTAATQATNAAAKKHAVDRSNTTAARLQAAAAKLSKRKPKTASKLTSHANRLRQRATAIVGGWFDAVLGFDPANLAVDTGKLQAAADAVIASADAADSLVTAADILNYMLPDVDRAGLAKLTDLITSGNAIMQRAVDLIENFDPNVIDTKTAPAVAKLNSDAAAWRNQLQIAIAKPTSDTPPPGTAPTIQAVIDAVTGVPNSGNPGDSVVITGTNFTGATSVMFGGTPAVFTVNNSTQITAAVPQSPVPGLVTVTTPSGTATSALPFTLASAISYGDGGYGSGGGGGGGGYGSGSSSGADYGDEGSGDDAESANAFTADADQYTFDQSPPDRGFVDDNQGGYDPAVYDDQGGYASPQPTQPTPTPIDVASWASKDAYSTGDVVRYHDSYYRATRDVASRWLFNNATPNVSDAWTKLAPKKTTAETRPDATLGFSSWDPWTMLYDPAGGLYRYMNQDSDPGYQPRAVNTYWQNRAQSPIAASATQRLQLAQQLQQNLQNQLAARYAALAAASSTQPQLVGEYGMSKKIIGPALCGFADYFLSTPPSLVGMARRADGGASGITGLATHVPQKGSLSHGVTVKFSPGGHPVSSLHVNPKVLHRRDPATVQHAAQLAAQHAQTVAKNVLNAVSHVTAQQKKSGKAPPVPARKTVMGAAARPMRPPTPRHVPAASLSQLKSQAQALQKSASKLTSSAATYKKQTDQAKTKQGAVITHQKTVTKLHGFIGFIGADASGLVPGQPGYDATTDPGSPSYVPSVDDTGSVPPPSGTAASQVAGPPDYGAGPTPTPDSVTPQPEIDYVPSSDLGPDDWAQFYTSDPSGVLPNGSGGTPVPLGAIYFDGSRPIPFKGVGNATVFYGTLPGGLTPAGGPNSGYEWHGSGGFDWALVLQGPGGGYSGGKNYDKVNNPDNGMIHESQKSGWGPLIGDPGQPDMAGLRFDVAKMAFFWPFDKAPGWAQAPVKQAAFNAAVVAWKAAQTAGQADYVAAQLQDKLDAQTAAATTRQQAQQDIGLAMQQKQFEQQQAQQQAALDLQMQKDDAAMQMQQAQLDAQQTATDQQAQAQEQQLYFQAQQQALAMPPSPDDQGGGYVDQGGGDGSGLDNGDDSPESASDSEAAEIDAMVGTTADILLRKQQLRNEGAVGGDGEVIGLDEYGNVLD